MRLFAFRYAHLGGSMRSPLVPVCALLRFAACAGDPAAPNSSASVAAQPPAAPWGPETPFFNLEVVLRGQGFGL